MNVFRKFDALPSAVSVWGRTHGIGRFGLLGALATLAMLLISPCAPAQQSKPTEYQVKAAYLYNFGLFVSWPATGRKTDPFVICVLGKDPFGPALDSTLAGETIDGHSILVRRITSPQDAPSCRILFISQSESKRLDAILSGLDKSGVLTVSDISDFSRHGGMIQFVWDRDNVRFEVNLTAARSAGLTLSSELLKVATSIRRDAPTGF